METKDILITPEVFAAKMKKINKIAEKDTDNGHRLADDLMCEILKQHGYGKGVEIFENMRRWYA